MKISTFNHVEDNLAKLQDISWADLAAKLLLHTVTPNKEDVGLFNATLFGGSGHRRGSTAVEVSAVLLDVDNSIKQGHPEYEKGIKKRVTDPVDPYTVEILLHNREFGLYTTHSNTDYWPRFRVVLPLATPVAMEVWKPFAKTILAELGLSEYEDCIDDCSARPVQMFYWPTHAPGAIPYAVQGHGEFMTFDASKIEAATKGATGSSVPSASKASTVSPFTPAQIATFWAHELPDLDQPTDGSEWRCACPLHKGHNPKFYINPNTGCWFCQSHCETPNKGGDIYKYAMVNFGLSFPEAKRYVHEITGDPNADHTPEMLQGAIAESNLEDVSALVGAIAKQPKKAQPELVQQLITTHQLDVDTITDQVEAVNKIVRFKKAGFEPEVPTEPNEFGLLLSDERYEMDGNLIYQTRWVSTPKGLKSERAMPPLADRPIWPAAIGQDLATGQHHLKLAWFGSKGFAHEGWYPEDTIRQKDRLLKLDDAPISLESVGRISSWLTYAKTCTASPVQDVTTEIGWTGSADDMYFVLPGDKRIEYIGKPTVLMGEINDWALGLKELLTFGPDAYRALIAIGMCAGSPLVRLVTKRNPALGLVAPSGSGKNKIIEYGLSIWDAHKASTIVATQMLGASAKGIQDHAHGRSPDLPIFVDELQQLYNSAPELVEAIMYWLGSGRRRITSSKAQIAVGGESRYAANLWAAETHVVQGLQAGAQNRTIVLEGPPLPKTLTSNKSVTLIERAGNNNVGVMGRGIVDLLNSQHTQHIAEIEYTASSIINRPSFSGDDHYSIAIAMQGLRVLSELTRLSIDVDSVQDWFVDELSGARGTTRDREEDVFTYVLEALLGMAWDAGGAKDVLQDQQGGIAWRKSQATSPEFTPLEINPTHPVVVELLKRKGIKEIVGQQWGKKGWLHANGPNAKRVRSKTGTTHSGGAYAWRITVAGLARLGLDANFNPL